jgi:3-oxoacyl-[acyl-carrier protein] reductase
MELNGKKALITGAARGIGKAIADRFIAVGAEVWGLDVREPAERNDKMRWVSADLSKLTEIDGLIDKIIKEAGGFDIVVNNAGITKDVLSFRMSVEDWQKVIDINLSAAFFISRTALKDMLMVRKRGGSIINMASVVGIHGNAGQANYSASKAGLIGITKSLANEGASRQIRVNALAPGFIESDMTNAIPQDIREKMIAGIPMKRMGKPEDIAEAALFLASDASSYITGQVLPIDGGMFF